MRILAYIVKEWDTFVGWLEALVHIHQTTGTLPPVPVSGGAPVTVTSPPVAVPLLPAGVTLVDSVNGLVKIDAADAVDPAHPGQLWAAAPMLASLTPGSQAYATVNWNTAAAKSADQGLGLHTRVNTMVPAKNPDGTEGWGNSNPIVWIDNAWSIGSEFATWDAAIAQAVAIATRMANATPGDVAGFSPHH